MITFLGIMLFLMLLFVLLFAFGFTGIALVIGAVVYKVLVQSLIDPKYPTNARVVSFVCFILFLTLWVVSDHSVIAGVIAGAFVIVLPCFTKTDESVDPPESGPGGGCF